MLTEIKEILKSYNIEELAENIPEEYDWYSSYYQVSDSEGTLESELPDGGY